MSAENPKGEPTIDIDNRIQEIELGVSFKPYHDVGRFCIPGEGDKPLLVPEQYDHVLDLRKEVRLYGNILGVIDVISEEPNAAWESMMVKGSDGVEKPFGQIHFESIYGSNGKEEFIEEPRIIRVSFLVRTPNDYAKLLSTYANVKLGDEEYILIWNKDRPTVKKNLKTLEEQSKPLLMIEKNLFNIKEIDQQGQKPLKNEDKKRFEKNNLGRCTFVWLPKNLNQLQTIEFTFNQFGGGSTQEQPINPVEPEKELLPVSH